MGWRVTRGFIVSATAVAALAYAAPAALAAPPANDNFANAQSVGPALPLNASGNNFEATAEPNEPDHAAAAYKSVWFQWTAPSTGAVKINVCASEFHPTVAVYTGLLFGLLTKVAGNSADTGDCGVALSAAAGTTYKIAIDGMGSPPDAAHSAFALQIHAAGVAGNDDFANARSVGTGLPVNTGGTNAGATAEATEPSHGGTPPSKSVWFTWTAGVSGPTRVDVCSAEIRARVGVYTGTALGGLAGVATSGTSGDCRLYFAAVAGTTYALAVDSFGQEGEFGLKVAAATPPANDNFANPQTIPSDAATITASNVDATGEAGEPPHHLQPAARSIWFNWTAPNSALMVLDVCSGFDSDYTAGVVDVYTGSSLSSLTYAHTTGSGPDCSVDFYAEPGVTYKIAIDGAQGGLHYLQIYRYLRGPSNDDFADAQAVGPGLPFSVFGSIDKWATAQTGEPGPGGQPASYSVWFSWTPVSSGAARVDVCQAEFDPRVGVYIGTAVDALATVVDNGNDDNCRVEFAASAGQTYRIAVDGVPDDYPDGFTLNIHSPSRPANDNLAASQTIPSTENALVSGANVDATSENLEPARDAIPAWSSVWFNWTAPGNGTVTVDTCASNFDTVLGIYTGSGFANLAEHGSNDDAAACAAVGTDLGSSLKLTVVAGTNYKIAVDGFNDGQFNLAIHGALTLPPGPFVGGVKNTGKRAAALRKCKKIKKPPAHKRCKKRANKLPV
jgi:hypothetical protein